MGRVKVRSKEWKKRASRGRIGNATICKPAVPVCKQKQFKCIGCERHSIEVKLVKKGKRDRIGGFLQCKNKDCDVEWKGRLRFGALTQKSDIYQDWVDAVTHITHTPETAKKTPAELADEALARDLAKIQAAAKAGVKAKAAELIARQDDARDARSQRAVSVASGASRKSRGKTVVVAVDEEDKDLVVHLGSRRARRTVAPVVVISNDEEEEGYQPNPVDAVARMRSFIKPIPSDVVVTRDPVSEEIKKLQVAHWVQGVPEDVEDAHTPAVEGDRGVGAPSGSLTLTH